ncbi:MAG: hypothetical protein U0R78_02645 [Nocardioidaceae bacterium]
MSHALTHATRRAAQVARTHSATLPAWRLPWTRGRLLAGALLTPVLVVGVRELVGADRLAQPGWATAAFVVSVLGGLVVGSYLPSHIYGHRLPLGTSVQAVTALFYVALAGYVLAEPGLTTRHATFAIGLLVFGIVLRTHGTRLQPMRH